jgi:hypothetical protein
VLEELEAQLQGVVPPKFSEPAERELDGFAAPPSGLRLADVAGMEDVKARLEAAVSSRLKGFGGREQLFPGWCWRRVGDEPDVDVAAVIRRVDGVDARAPAVVELL